MGLEVDTRELLLHLTFFWSLISNLNRISPKSSPAASSPHVSFKLEVRKKIMPNLTRHEVQHKPHVTVTSVVVLYSLSPNNIACMVLKDQVEIHKASTCFNIEGE